MLLSTRPKLAFFDIDGTLIGRSGLLSDRTIKAISSLRQAGVTVAIATGRPMFGALKICQQLEIDCYSMFSSGALLANPKNDKVLFEANIEITALEDCIKSTKELGLYTELYSKNDYFIENETALTPKHTYYLGHPPALCAFAEIIHKHPINKVVTISDSAELDLNQQLLTEKMSSLVCLSSKGASHPEMLFNNITSAAGGRREGFYKLLSEADARPEETIAFGDARSDIIFLDVLTI